MSDGSDAQLVATEQQVIGAMLIAPACIDVVAAMLSSGDFYQPRHSSLFEVLASMHADGKAIDAITVADEIGARGEWRNVGGGSVYLVELVGGVVTATNVEYHAALIKQASRRRRAVALGQRIQQVATDVAGNDELLTALARESIALEVLVDEHESEQPISGLSTWDDFIRLHGGQVRDWVVPGIISARDVWMVLAPPGAGKTTLSRQIVWAIAAGVNPFNPLLRIEPKRTLLVDLENDQGEAADESSSFLAQVKRIGDWDDDRARIWAWPEGLNLRKASDAQMLERVIAEARPSLVCFGSLYKAFSRGGSDWDTAAGETREVFDRIRRRHGVALWIEHHMPKAQDGGRKASPFGSSVWEWWPSHGRLLERAVPDKPGSPYRFSAPFRGDRGKRDVPVGFTRGGRLPWSAIWDDAELDLLIEAAA